MRSNLPITVRDWNAVVMRTVETIVEQSRKQETGELTQDESAASVIASSLPKGRQYNPIAIFGQNLYEHRWSLPPLRFLAPQMQFQPPCKPPVPPSPSLHLRLDRNQNTQYSVSQQTLDQENNQSKQQPASLQARTSRCHLHQMHPTKRQGSAAGCIWEWNLEGICRGPDDASLLRPFIEAIFKDKAACIGRLIARQLVQTSLFGRCCTL